MILDNTPTTTTTTTGQKFSPQKYRGHTLEILGVLSEFGGLTTHEIAEKTGILRGDVWHYCKRGYHRGIFEKKERWGWSVSPLGLLVLSVTTTTTTTMDTTGTQQGHNRDTTGTQQGHNRDTTRTPKARQHALAAFTSRDDLTETDKNVVVELTGHYERTGVKYRLFKDEYEVAEAMEIPVVDVIPTLRHLREEGCVYFRRDPLGWKIGLMKAFVWRLGNV